MAQERSQEEFGHVCPLPWPNDPELPEGHVCECSRHWLYQPARWEPIYTLEELQLKQAAGAFLRGIVPTLGEPKPAQESRVILPIRQRP